MGTLTPRQLEALQYIRNFIAGKGYSPTLNEIAKALDVTKSTVQQYLAALEEREVIRRERYAHRSIEIIDPEYAAHEKTEMPLLGRIAAGESIESVEETEILDIADLLHLDAEGDFFMLEVSGNSMIEEGIFDGDYVVVEKTSKARDGQPIVALLPDHTVTLKKLYREENRVRLQPANPEMEPIYVSDVTIQGVVRGVVRAFA